MTLEKLTPSPKSEDPLAALTRNIEGWLLPYAYDLVHVEAVVSRQKILRVFIDHLSPGRAIQVEDCIAVNKILDQPLENSSEVEQIFKGPYELEVSSPGVDRPLRRPQDFERFNGSDVRVHLLRPLTAVECANEEYHLRNPRQKNYIGKLKGLENGESIRLEVEAGKDRTLIRIPMQLVSKCNIEPRYNFKGAELT